LGNTPCTFAHFASFPWSSFSLQHSAFSLSSGLEHGSVPSPARHSRPGDGGFDIVIERLGLNTRGFQRHDARGDVGLLAEAVTKMWRGLIPD
jgi:hypothetical protein